MAARRRRSRREPELIVDGLSDALATAMDLAAVFLRGHAVVMCNGRGQVAEMLMFTADEHTPEDAIQAGLEVHRRQPWASRMLLVSVIDEAGLDMPFALDVEMWRSARERCGREGVELWEWIQTGGELLRSLSITERTAPEWQAG